MTKGGMEWLEDRVEGLRERSDSGGDKAKGEGVVIDSSVVVKSACRGGRCVLERAPTPHI